MTRRILLVFALLAVPSAATAQSTAPPTSGVPVPDRSVTTQDDAASLEVNPAGLGFLESSELRYGYSLGFPGGPDNLNDEHAVYAALGTRLFAGGLSLQWLDRSYPSTGPITYQKLSLGSALRPFDSLSVGASLNLFGSAGNRNLNRLVSYDLGFQWRPSQFLGLGFAVRNVNHPYFGSNRGVPARIESGAALRLLDGHLLVDTRMRWRPSNGAFEARPRVVVQPLDGLRLFGRGNFPVTRRSGTRESITFGAEFSLGRVGLQTGGTVAPDASGSRRLAGHRQQVWLTPNPRPSLVPTRGNWIRIDLRGNIAERASGGFLTPSSREFLELVTYLRALADDPRVAGILFDIGSGTLGYGQAWELRREIRHLRDSGKKTVGFLHDSGLLPSYIAAATDHTLVMPAEPYDPEGIRITTNHYGEALANIGVEAQFVRVGKYKSAPEAFVRSTPSEPTLEQTDELVEDLHGEIVRGIARGRGLETAEVRRAIDEIPHYPSDAVRRGLVDHVLYPDELRGHLRRKFGTGRLLGSSYDPTPGSPQGWEGGPVVAVLQIEGSIVQGSSREAPLFGQTLSGSKTLTQTIERLGRSPNVRGIVVRIDSPGGAAVASDLVYRAIRRVSKVKPVVASMGNVAASGGYYVASAADSIFATPNTVTGSIGIFVGKFNVQRLASRIGINHSVTDRGKRTGRFDLYTPWDAEQRESVAQSIEYLYELFLQQAAASRPFGPEELDERARGRVWSGSAAEQVELVDHVGGLIDAIRHVEERAGLEPGTARYETYPSRSTLFQLAPRVSSVSGRGFLDRLRDHLTRDAPRDTAFREMLRQLSKAVRLPLVYPQEEPLMLPPRAIQVQPD